VLSEIRSLLREVHGWKRLLRRLAVQTGADRVQNRKIEGKDRMTQTVAAMPKQSCAVIGMWHS
jgi:hypothetical protein